ncbi:MAG: glycosyltransferase family 4 protein [Proteobacteria bacterium]|nr:glycosyltransferase family 4 protein [Pseudomonadota bacterium]
MKICFISSNYQFFTGNATGGAERQILKVSEYLAKRNHEIYVILLGYSNGEFTKNGVSYLSGWKHTHGLRFARYFTYRLPNLKRVLNELNADVYYTRGPSLITPSVVKLSTKNKSLSVIGLASDDNLDFRSGKIMIGSPNPSVNKSFGTFAFHYFKNYALREADLIIAQNNYQAMECKKNALRYRVISNIVELPAAKILNVCEDVEVAFIANTAGSSRGMKGINKFLDLVGKLPHIRFIAIGKHDKKLHENNDVRSYLNLQWLGALTHEETLKNIARSKIVVNLSLYEGFSNVILEAWSLGKPVVSLHVNPNGLFDDGKLGYCAAGDIGLMASITAELLSSQEKRKSIGACCRDYIISEHSPEKICDQYEDAFSSNKMM